jgi:alpha-L-rhamnosidase
MNQNRPQDAPQARPRLIRAVAAWSSLAAVTLSIAALPALTAQAPAPSLETIHKNFIDPPNDSRPMVRWWWFGTAVVKPEILRELQQMKADGLQGAEMAFEYPEVLDDPSKDLKNLPFLSPEMLDDVAYAQSEGRKLGLRIDLTLCSGWPYGGPSISLEEAVTRIRVAQLPVPAGATSVAVPALQEGESLISADIANPATPSATPVAILDTAPPPAPTTSGGRPGYAPPTPEGAALPLASGGPAAGGPAGAGGRGAGRGGRGFGGPPPPSFDAASAKLLTVSGNTAAIEPSDKPRIALFFILGHTKQQVKRSAVGAEGYVMDPFSRQATDRYLKTVGDPLIAPFGNTPPYAIFSDSLEAFGADWTPNLPSEFKKRRGYDLIPHLPELAAGGNLAADNVRHDYGKTLTELINENYLTPMTDWAVAHRTKFRSQTYGEPAVSFSSQNLASLAEGEGPQWRGFSTLRWATSANHVFDHTVTSGETFTWLHSPVFRAIPLDMKEEADVDFIMGENQIIGHGWGYSPPDGEVPEPGWSLYAATSLNNHNPWHPVMPAVTGYIGRMSYLMRQGKPANQVAILLPTDDAWASFAPGRDSVTGVMARWVTPTLMSTILNAGYNVDFTDAEAIDKVGIKNQVLILPPTDRIPVTTLAKIAAFVAAGGHAIAIGHLPTLTPDGKPLKANMAEIAVVGDEASLAKALPTSTPPDFQATGMDDATKSVVGFIRRKLPSTDFYLVINNSNKPVDLTATFATTHKNAEEWDGDTGMATTASAAAQSVHLEPYGSRVYVFTDAPSTAKKPKDAIQTAKIDISTAWTLSLTGINKTQPEPFLTDWTADPATKNYSGEGIYERDLNLPNPATSPVYLEVDGGKPMAAGMRTGGRVYAFYDPPVQAAALVTINGQPAGALWHPPYKLDITKLLKVGTNHIEIRVYNTAINAWAALPPHDYAPLIAKYGDRFQMQDLNLLAPVPSGILGQVFLVTTAAEPNP